MAESLFDIFGDHLTRQAVKNVSRQPLTNIENMGKKVSTGPVKPNEPMKKTGEVKKSFLCNTGKALQSTPARQVFSPRGVNVGSIGGMIYTDENATDRGFNFEEIEFTKPPARRQGYHSNMFDFLEQDLKVAPEVSPPTPPPQVKYSVDFDCSYQDEFFTDDFSNDSLPDDSDLGLPSLY